MKFLANTFYILGFPSFLLSPMQAIVSQPQSYTEILIPRDASGAINPWGYLNIQNLSAPDGCAYIDYYEDFIDLLEREEFLEQLSYEELENIVDFVTWIVEVSVSRSRPDLQEYYQEEIDDLIELLQENDFEERDHSIDLFYNSLKRRCHHLGHWCKKHKKSLLIGEVIAVDVDGNSDIAVGNKTKGKRNKHKGRSNRPKGSSTPSAPDRSPGTQFPLFPQGPQQSHPNTNSSNSESVSPPNEDKPDNSDTTWGFITSPHITLNFNKDKG